MPHLLTELLFTWLQERYPNAKFSIDDHFYKFNVIRQDDLPILYVYEDYATTGTTSEYPNMNRVSALDPKFFDQIEMVLVERPTHKIFKEWQRQNAASLNSLDS